MLSAPSGGSLDWLSSHLPVKRDSWSLWAAAQTLQGVNRGDMYTGLAFVFPVVSGRGLLLSLVHILCWQPIFNKTTKATWLTCKNLLNNGPKTWPLK